MINKLLVCIGLIVVLSCLYSYCYILADAGEGFPGYNGFNHKASFWYLKGHDESFNPSNRETSTDGHRFSRRGLTGGK